MPKAQPFDMGAFLDGVAPSSRRQYRRYQSVFKIGDPAHRVYFVRAGRIKISVLSEQGKEAVVGIIQAGQFLGQSCLGGHNIRTSAATAMEESDLIEIRKHVFLSMLANDRQFADAFMRDLLERNEQIEADLIDQLFNSVEKRLARVLLLLAHYGNHREPQPVLGEISHATLAEKIGTTRSRLGIFMRKFKRLGFISYNGDLHVHPSLLNAVLHEWPGDDEES